MIAYVLRHRLGNKVDVTESKRIANKSLKSNEFDVWIVEGRKGSSFDRRLKALLECLQNEVEIPEHVAIPHELQKITRVRSEMHNKKISQSMSGVGKSASHCASISEAMIGNTNFQK
jgi:hypothetical protein